jgi:hypothetical protein
VSRAIQNQCGAQTTTYGDEVGPTIQAFFSHVEAAQVGGLRKVNDGVFFYARVIYSRRALNCWASVSSAHLR